MDGFKDFKLQFLEIVLGNERMENILFEIFKGNIYIPNCIRNSNLIMAKINFENWHCIVLWDLLKFYPMNLKRWEEMKNYTKIKDNWIEEQFVDIAETFLLGLLYLSVTPLQANQA